MEHITISKKLIWLLKEENLYDQFMANIKDPECLGFLSDAWDPIGPYEIVTPLEAFQFSATKEGYEVWMSFCSKHKLS